MAKVMLVLSVAWKINFLQPYIMTVTCSDTSCGRVYLMRVCYISYDYGCNN